VNASTLLIYNLSTSETTYGLSFPQDMGTWGQEGSDGQIWIGCMSCHAENGAHRYMAYNSKEHHIGSVGAVILQSLMLMRIPLPGASIDAEEGSIGFKSVDDVLANPNVLKGKSPLEVAKVLEGHLIGESKH